MNGNQYIRSLQYYSDINCSDAVRLRKFLGEELEAEQNQRDVINFLDKKIKSLKEIIGNSKIIDQKVALSILIVKDLEVIVRAAKKIKLKDPEEEISKANLFFIKELDKLGLKAVDYKVEVVDQFPSIWAKYGDEYGAVGLGPGYKKFYNVDPGIYLHRNHLAPTFTTGILLPHEIMHHVINYYSDTEMGRGLEEGLCELIGDDYLGSKMVGIGPVKKRFIYSFYRDDMKDSMEEYYVFTRQAAYLYLNYGLDGIIALIKGGRTKIREVEQYLSAGEFEKIDLPKGHWEPEFTAFISHMILTYVPHFVVSPLARYIADFIKAGDDLEPLRKKLNVPKNEFYKAIDELDDEVDLIQCHKGNVNYSVLPYALKAKSLRYRIGKKEIKRAI